MITIIGAIVLCVIASIIIGMFWYSPMLFGTIWAKLAKVSLEKIDKEKLNMMYGMSAFGSLITATIVCYIMSQVDIRTLQQALVFGGMIWLGFVFPSTMVNNLFQGKPRLLTIIDSGYYLVSILAMTTILYFFIFP